MRVRRGVGRWAGQHQHPGGRGCPQPIYTGVRGPQLSAYPQATSSLEIRHILRVEPDSPARGVTTVTGTWLSVAQCPGLQRGPEGFTSIPPSIHRGRVQAVLPRPPHAESRMARHLVARAWVSTRHGLCSGARTWWGGRKSVGNKERGCSLVPRTVGPTQEVSRTWPQATPTPSSLT